MRERIRRNVGLGMAVILLVSSLGVPPASAGTVREGKSLAEAEMDVRSAQNSICAGASNRSGLSEGI